jgi:DNA modification methylase
VQSYGIQTSGDEAPEEDPLSAVPTIALANKQLIGIPWRVAFALQADGWYLRQDIIWAKPNPMPESVTDRCTKAHEYIFLLSKGPRYYFDARAIAEPAIYAPGVTTEVERGKGYYAGKWSNPEEGSRHDGSFKAIRETRNKRSVWTVASQPFSDAHFATYPPDLIEPCILAGCPVGGTVLDPFGGAGTTGLVADRHGRDAVLIELNPEYAAMAERRLRQDGGMFIDVSVDAPPVAIAAE